MVPVHYFASQSRNGAEQGRVCLFFFSLSLSHMEPTSSGSLNQEGRPSDFEGKKMQSGLQAQTHQS
jgi:hypothetical protein